MPVSLSKLEGPPGCDWHGLYARRAVTIIEPRARSPGVHLTPARVSVGTFTIRPDENELISLGRAAAPMNSMLLSGTKSRRGFSDAANI